MRKVLLITIILLVLAPMVASQEIDVRDAMVKLYVYHDAPSFYSPWRTQGPASRVGSGVIIDGNRILTNAHVVSDATFLLVRRYGTVDRVVGMVEEISHQSDLALVSVPDHSFFRGVQGLSIGGLPPANSEVHVYGFPIGGESLSITKGIVSRIELQPYVFSSVRLLAGQIDASINPGSSGGPVIVDGEIGGIVMQVLSSAENVGYMVPPPVISHFLQGIDTGDYQGFPGLGVRMQAMESRSLRQYYGMGDDVSGALITAVVPGSPAEGLLRAGDILLSLGGYDVANDVTVEYLPRERVGATYAVHQYQIGERMPITILRDGERHEVTAVLSNSLEDNHLVPLYKQDRISTYFVYGGLVFSPLSGDLLRIFGRNWYFDAPTSLTHYLLDNRPDQPGDQVIVVLRVLPDEVNLGYQDMEFGVVAQINDEPIRNMEDLVVAVESEFEGEYLRVKLTDGSVIVINRQSADRRAAHILQLYGISADRSEDLR